MWKGIGFVQTPSSEIYSDLREFGGITNRDAARTLISPTACYGDMPLSAQPVLLATLDAQRKLGITLSKSLLMTPTKSVTAVVGLFGEPQPSSHARCADCLCRDFCRILRTGRPCWKR